MADGLSSNYNWVKPEVSASPETWGNKINTVIESIDNKVKTLDTITAGGKVTLVGGDFVGMFNSEAGGTPAIKVTFDQFEAGFRSLYATYYVSRANHTGTQAIDTVSGLQDALDGKQVAVVGATVLELGKNRVGDGLSAYYFYSVGAGAASASIVRASGANGALSISQTGTGGVSVSSGSGNFNVTGAITATGNISAYSDARLKKHIRTIKNGLRLVRKMRGVYFTKKGRRGTGVVAQEMLEALPQVVTRDKAGYLLVDYGSITGALIEAVKELADRVEELESKK